VTPDYINPDRPWPFVDALGAQVRSFGFTLAPRLPVYDAYVDRPGFLDPALYTKVKRAS
jgi:FO synthase